MVVKLSKNQTVDAFLLANHHKDINVSNSCMGKVCMYGIPSTDHTGKTSHSKRQRSLKEWYIKPIF
jgi:hypothetical protein